jgi:hypothetical protein
VSVAQDLVSVDQDLVYQDQQQEALYQQIPVSPVHLEDLVVMQDL